MDQNIPILFVISLDSFIYLYPLLEFLLTLRCPSLLAVQCFDKGFDLDKLAYLYGVVI